MKHIEPITASDILGQLPDLQAYSSADIAPVEPDVLICAVGFEDRATALVDIDPPVRPKHLILVEYATNAPDNARSLAKLRSLAPEREHCVIPYERSSFRQKLRAELSAYSEPAEYSIVVDVSAMASFVLFKVLETIVDHFDHSSLRLLYAEAAIYYPSVTEWNEFRQNTEDAPDLLAIAEHFERVNFQSRGIESTYDSERFPGRNTSGMPTQMVAVPNFSLERMKTMLARAEGLYTSIRDETVWLLGDPPNKALHGWRLDALGGLYQVDSKGIPVSTLNYKHIIRVLEDRWDEAFIERHLVIATLGSKMQHVGTFLFLLMHPDVGLMLSEPSHFVVERFSEGVGDIWSLSLGKVDRMAELLRSRGCLAFHWQA